MVAFSTKIIYNKPFNIDFVLHFIELIEKQKRIFLRFWRKKKPSSFIKHARYINVNK